MAISMNSSIALSKQDLKARWRTDGSEFGDLQKSWMIYIETPTGQFIKVIMKPSSTILELKKHVGWQVGLYESQMCLIFMGKCLENEKTIFESGVSYCSVLELITTKQIGIRNKDGEMIHLEFSSHETIASIKLKMADTFGIPVQRQCLFHKGKQLKNYRQLCTYKIRNGDQLHLASMIQIFIRNLCGKTRVFVIEPFAKIETFKKLIENKEGVPCKWINLSYAGKILESHRTLSDYNIQNESTVNMNIRLCCNGPKKSQQSQKNCEEDEVCCGELYCGSDLVNSTMIQC